MTRQDVLPERVSAVVGGPLGRRASARAGSVRHLLSLVAALTAVPLVLGILRQGHCIANGWSGEDQFWRGCFSDLPAQHQLAGLDAGLGAWARGDVPLEQLPVLSGLMTALAGLVPDGDWVVQTRWYFALWAVVLAGSAVATVIALGLARPTRLDLATQLALSPVFVVAAFLSPDLLVVALVVWAMWAWARGRPRLTGVLLGVGLLAHLWVVPVTLLLVLSALTDRRGRDLRQALLPTVAIAGAGLILTALLTPGVWSRPVEVLRTNGSGYGSPWHVPALLGHPLPFWAVVTLGVLGWLAAAVLAWWFVSSAWRRPSWPQLVALVLPVVLITGRATPVQAAVWVVPLVILAGVSWRTHLSLVAVEAVHATALWLYLGGLSDAAKGLPAPWYAVVILGRVVAWGFVLWSVWYTPGDQGAPGAEAASEGGAAPVVGGGDPAVVGRPA